MKKTLKRIVTVAAAATMCLAACAFAACGEEDVPRGETGPQGEQGIQGPAGQPGKDGTIWFSGAGLPAANADAVKGAKEGDFYINTNTNSLYRFHNGAWQFFVSMDENDAVSVWDGTIPGWQAPDLSDDEVIKNRPASYVVSEDKKTVDIYNAEAFAWFAYRSVIGKTGFEGVTVNLHSDIDLADHLWVPIGLGARSNAKGMPFKGTFNGNGHTIYNLNGTKFGEAIQFRKTDGNPEFYIEYSNGDVEADIPVLVNYNREMPYGLFATTQNAVIKNLNVENVKIDIPAKLFDGDTPTKKGDEGVTNPEIESENWNYSYVADSVGTFVGYAYGNLTLENCTAGAENGEDYIRNCQCAAGLVGRAYAGGGIDGKEAPYGTIAIKNCKNYVNVTGLVPNDATHLNGVKSLANDKTGGIICFPRWYGEMIVESCGNFGAIEGHQAGGIVGTRQGTGLAVTPVRIVGCVNYGDITASGYGGGIIGYRTVAGGGSQAIYVIANCTNYGTLRGRKMPNGTVSVSALGGIAGFFQSVSANVIFSDCKNYGNLIAESNKAIGGVVGTVKLTDATDKAKITVTGGLNAGSLITKGTKLTSVESLSCAVGSVTGTSDNVIALSGFVNAGGIVTNYSEGN